MTDPDDGEHVWLAPGEAPNTSKWTCCALCMVIKRADGRPQSRCRGLVRIELRSGDEPCPVCGNSGVAWDTTERRDVPCGGIGCTVIDHE